MRFSHGPDGGNKRLKRLAQSIDALAVKDEKYLQYLARITALRRSAAVELHTVCADFVHSVNRLLTQTELGMDPGEYSEDAFLEDGTNLLQISIRGRNLQITFTSTPELVSTEEFRVPYTLAGAVRIFNQELLDRDIIEEHLLFYTVERQKNMWRFFDARTYRSGAFDQDYLISLLELLI